MIMPDKTLASSLPEAEKSEQVRPKEEANYDWHGSGLRHGDALDSRKAYGAPQPTDYRELLHLLQKRNEALKSANQIPHKLAARIPDNDPAKIALQSHIARTLQAALHLDTSAELIPPELIPPELIPPAQSEVSKPKSLGEHSFTGGERTYVEHFGRPQFQATEPPGHVYVQSLEAQNASLEAELRNTRLALARMENDKDASAHREKCARKRSDAEARIQAEMREKRPRVEFSHSAFAPVGKQIRPKVRQTSSPVANPAPHQGFRSMGNSFTSMRQHNPAPASNPAALQGFHSNSNRAAAGMSHIVDPNPMLDHSVQQSLYQPSYYGQQQGPTHTTTSGYNPSYAQQQQILTYDDDDAQQTQVMSQGPNGIKLFLE